MSQKVKIFVYVDEEIYQAFKDYVFAKYGTLSKYLGEELTKAMADYLRDSRNAHTQSLQHILSKPNKRHLHLLMWLIKECPKEALYSEVRQYIYDNYGTDQRTVKKYLHDFLIGGGFVEHRKQLRGNADHILEVKAERIYNYLTKHISEKELRENGIFREAIIPTKEEIIEEKKESKGTIRAYAAERYEAGDSLDEIQDRVSDFGLELGKKAIRNIVRKARREDYG